MSGMMAISSARSPETTPPRVDIGEVVASTANVEFFREHLPIRTQAGGSRPVPLQVVREIWKARPMNIALDKLVMKNRRIRFDEVRSEGKLLVSLLRGW